MLIEACKRRPRKQRDFEASRGERDTGEEFRVAVAPSMKAGVMNEEHHVYVSWSCTVAPVCCRGHQSFHQEAEMPASYEECLLGGAWVKNFVAPVVTAA